VPIVSIVIVLLASPLGMFVCHMLIYRLLRARGRRPTAHTSAFAAVAVCGLVLLAAVGALTWSALTTLSMTVVCLFAYVLAVYGALAVLYIDIVNIAETSLHMHLLLEVAWTERPSLDRLVERYSPGRMVEERLDRLTALGQVRLVDGRYHLANRSALRLSQAIDLWRTVLGLPTSPQAAGARSDRSVER
jgi:hypothetical protein